MKKFIAITLIFINLFYFSFVEAEEKIPYFIADADYKTGTVVISGYNFDVESNINMLVLNPSYNSDNALSSLTAIQNQRNIEVDKNGEFTYSFKLFDFDKNASSLDGKFNVYIGGNQLDKRLDGDFYFISHDALDSFIDELLNKEELKREEFIKSEVFTRVFKIDSYEPYMKADKKRLSETFYNLLSDYKKSGDIYTVFEEINKIFKKSCMLEMWNNKITTMLFNSDLELLHQSDYEIDTFDAQNKVTIIDIYENILSYEGKKKTIDSMLNIGGFTLKTFYKKLAEKIILFSLTNQKDVGYAHIEKILTPENIAYAGYTLPYVVTSQLSASIAEYSGDFSSFDELEAYIKGVVNTPIYPSGNSGNSSSSSSSSSGNLGLGSSYTYDDTVKSDSTNTAFSDLEDCEWAKIAILDLYKRKIINGKGSELFCPEDKITKEELVKMVVTSFEIPESNEELKFLDVKKDSWYYSHLCSAYAKGIITGIDSNTFGTGNYVTRQEAVTVIYRSLGDTSETLENTFSDKNEISDYAKKAIDSFVSKGYINGYEDNTFRAGNYCTRAEVAVILYNVIRSLKS